MIVTRVDRREPILHPFDEERSELSEEVTP